MLKNILAIVGVIAIILGGALFFKFKPMIDLMPIMTNSEMQPIMEVLKNDFDGAKAAAGGLEEGASDTAAELFRNWIKHQGDIAATTAWSKKVAEGVTLQEVIDAINSVATERNIKAVGELPLSEELNARGVKSGVLHVMSFCNPETAREMVDFSPSMSAYLPCRVTIVEQQDGLWLYSLNMDMMVKMGQKLPPELKQAATQVRNTIWEMLERGSTGEF